MSDRRYALSDQQLTHYLATRSLLGADTNPKTAKGRAKGYATFILYMAPANLSGFQVCPMATKGCVKVCLNVQGRGSFRSVQASRIWKTQAFFLHRDAFMAKLVSEIRRSIRWAERKGLTPTFRLNGTSDIRWETVPAGDAPNVMALFPEVTFYDYTKVPNRRDIPANYHITFSYSGSNGIHAREALRNGMNVAAVFRSRDMVAGLKSVRIGTELFPVVDGDADDLRFLDSFGVVALYAKGTAKKDTSGFVLDSPSIPVGSLPVLRESLACVA